MLRVRTFRAIAAALALLTSLSTPVLALGHGFAHEHIASSHSQTRDAGSEHEHGGPPVEEHDHDGAPSGVDRALAEIRAAPHEHSHLHEIVELTASVRDSHSIGNAERSLIVDPPLVLPYAQFERVAAAALRTTALLPRPGPLSGTPHSPRAPPTR